MVTEREIVSNFFDIFLRWRLNADLQFESSLLRPFCFIYFLQSWHRQTWDAFLSIKRQFMATIPNSTNYKVLQVATKVLLFFLYSCAVSVGGVIPNPLAVIQRAQRDNFYLKRPEESPPIFCPKKIQAIFSLFIKHYSWFLWPFLEM